MPFPRSDYQILFLQRLSWVLGGLILCSGGLILLGWASGLPSDDFWLADFPTMKPNTALSLMLIGLGLIMARKTGLWQRALCGLAAVGLLVLGLGSLVESIIGMDIGLDHWMRPEMDENLFLRPGYLTMVSMMAAGGVLLKAALRCATGFRITDLLVLTGVVPTLITLFIWIYHPESEQQSVLSGLMDWHASIGFLLFFIVLSSQLPACTIHQLISRQTGGGRVFRGWLLPALGLPLVGGWVLHRLVWQGWTSDVMATGIFATVLAVTSVIGLSTGARRMDEWYRALKQEVAQRQLAEAEINLLLDSSGAALLMFDDQGRVHDANQAAADMLGWSLDELRTLEMNDLIPHVSRERHAAMMDNFNRQQESVKHNLHDPARIRALTASGKTVPIQASVSRLSVGEKYFYGAVMFKGHQLEEKIEQLIDESELDALTGVRNRRALETVLEQLSHPGEVSFGVAILALDIDHFKKVNDTWGHLVGDLVLKIFARTVDATLREEDALYRYGGEEFVVILTHQSEEQTLAVANRILAQVRMIEVPFDSCVHGESAPDSVYRGGSDINQPDLNSSDCTTSGCKSTSTESGPLTVRCSIGISTYPSESCETLHDCLRRADKALYRAKDAGRDRLVFADQTLSSTSEAETTS